ncbi:GNAT family N-acetyltransferase [Aliiroseovarius subalbicans]|uniref:GNAT family N-acetyltransferase n=1 Tax=Aliiroseovarius subalbicans TaxID=2925840 RepID=UPI001F590B34|nr:GNAT family N-acetyltransferase [Aliiroseovarius subalbicans]MCI2398332.1 GNAT family N-acetyltransferase [Aliiroseovarius subalbicans]
MTAVLITDRLTLRAPIQSDLEALHAIFSDPRAMRYWSHPAHEDMARTQETLEGMIASHRDTGLEFVIERDGVVIGKAGLWRVAELGYILHPDHWGQGLIAEALRPIIAAAWARFDSLDAITAEIDPRNTRSARVLNALGFVLTHAAKETIEVNGEWCDSAYYALQRRAPAPR